MLDQIHSDHEKEYSIRLGSDDGFQVYVNGEKVASRIIGRSVKPDSDWITITLQEGLNQVVFQVIQRNGGWGLHYKIEEKQITKELVKEHLFEMYRDLPEAAIVESGVNHLVLSKDPRSRLDIYHEIEFRWTDPFTESVLKKQKFQASEIPDSLSLPNETNYPLILEYAVLDNDEIVYSEHIPIFDGISFQNYADQIHSTDGPDEKWLQAAEQLFADEPGLEKRRPYST